MEEPIPQDILTSNSPMNCNVWEIHRKKWFRKCNRSLTSTHNFRCKIPSIQKAFSLTLVISPLSRYVFQAHIEVTNGNSEANPNFKITAWCRISDSQRVSIPIEIDESTVQVTTDFLSMKGQKKIFMPLLKNYTKDTCKKTVNGPIVINLLVSFFTPIRETPYSSKSQLFLKSISTFTEQNPDEGDIQITCEGKVFKTHKLILLCHSEVFRLMFKHKMRESITSTVNIENSSHIAVEALVKFLHTMCINENLQIKDLLELMSLANRYMIAELLKECSNLLGRKMDIDHSPQSLIIAHNLGLSDLKEELLEFIKENFNEVILLKDWEILYEKYPCLIQQLITKCIVSSNLTRKIRKMSN